MCVSISRPSTVSPVTLHRLSSDHNFISTALQSLPRDNKRGDRLKEEVKDLKDGGLFSNPILGLPVTPLDLSTV